METDLDLAIRAAWMSYVGLKTQSEIADRLGISRLKAHRLIARTLESGLVKVFVEQAPSACLALEELLIRQYDLKWCMVLPASRDDDPIPIIGNGGARFFHNLLETSSPAWIGVGHGRSLASVINHMPHISRPKTHFISLIGSLTRKSVTNPFEVISRLVERTGGEGYFLPVPMLADTVKDARVLNAQRSVTQVLELVRKCSICLIGIGSLQVLRQNGTLTKTEFQEIRSRGGVGELVGQFINAKGEVVDCEMNSRSAGIRLPDLRGREVIAIAGGDEKVAAIRATLRSKVLTGLVVDEVAASKVANDKR